LTFLTANPCENFAWFGRKGANPGPALRAGPEVYFLFSLGLSPANPRAFARGEVGTTGLSDFSFSESMHNDSAKNSLNEKSGPARGEAAGGALSPIRASQLASPGGKPAT
jgi:hypothetical protein